MSEGIEDFAGFLVCPNCEGTELSWQVYVAGTVPAAALGCDECSETVTTIPADQINAVLADWWVREIWNTRWRVRRTTTATVTGDKL